LKSFRQAFAGILTPSSLTPTGYEVDLQFIKLKFDLTQKQQMRKEVSKALATFRSRRVMFADINDELWEDVFKSLKNLRDVLVNTSAELPTGGEGSVKNAVDFMMDLITSYLAAYEADYVRFMHSNEYPELSAPYKEREWPSLGDAAVDLILMRKMLKQVIEILNEYADSGSIMKWEEPTAEADHAMHWYKYHRQKQKG
jgi:hypothetical protein